MHGSLTETISIGHCVNSKCCATDCNSQCGDCSSGTCIQSCGNPNGCPPISGTCDTAIACQNRAAGWSGSACLRFSRFSFTRAAIVVRLTETCSAVLSDTPGLCFGGSCVNATTYEACDRASVVTVRITFVLAKLTVFVYELTPYRHVDTVVRVRQSGVHARRSLRARLVVAVEYIRVQTPPLALMPLFFDSSCRCPLHTTQRRNDRVCYVDGSQQACGVGRGCSASG